MEVVQNLLRGQMVETKDFYFGEIANISLLTQDEERTLATRAFSGDEKAVSELVKANLRFVVLAAKKYKKSKLNMEDIIEEGNIGLIKAARKFNPEKGTRFITYAAWWIRAEIEKAIRETSTGIRFPSNKYEEMKAPKWNILNLDIPLNPIDENSLCLKDTLEDKEALSPEEKFIKNETIENVRNALAKLTSKERYVIERRFGFDGCKNASLSQVGLELGHCKERIRQIQKEAMTKLRTILSEDYGIDSLAA